MSQNALAIFSKLSKVDSTGLKEKKLFSPNKTGSIKLKEKTMPTVMLDCFIIISIVKKS